jgi:hypothetical protein
MNTIRSIGARNKHKGSHAERFYSTLFKNLGYDKCQTARFGSRLHDNAGIDLINIPFNVQIKAGVQKSLSPGKVLLNMSAQIDALFVKDSPVRNYPLLLIYRPKPFSNNTEDDIVYMSSSQLGIFNESSPEIATLEIKKRKSTMSNEFGVIIAVRFNDLICKLTPKSKTN